MNQQSCSGFETVVAVAVAVVAADAVAAFVAAAVVVEAPFAAIATDFGVFVPFPPSETDPLD